MPPSFLEIQAFRVVIERNSNRTGKHLSARVAESHLDSATLQLMLICVC